MGWNVSKEQRHARRVSVVLPLRYALAGAANGAKSSVAAMTTTLSYSGLSFVTPVSIPIRTRLNIDLSLSGEAEDLRMEASIVRIISELPLAEGFEYGVEFSAALHRETLERYVKSIDIVPILESMVARGAAALHLSAFGPPVYRVQGELVPAGEAMPPERLEEMIVGVLSPARRRQFLRDKEIDFPLTIPGVGRWRANVYYARGFVEAVFRAVNHYISTVTELGLPSFVQSLALSDSGLVIVTGPSASGKTTTLAAMTGHINRELSKVVITIEDPVEYVHDSGRGVVKQREVGTDTHTILHGLKHALRQNPDVIVVSDIRDRHVLDLLLRAAESGYLVLTTMPTPTTVATIDRIASMYPREERDAILFALAASLRGIVAQRLFRAEDGSLAVAAEVLTVNEGIRNAIRTNKLDNIHNLMTALSGSQHMDVSLRNLIVRGLITYEMALHAAHDPERLKKMVTDYRA